MTKIMFERKLNRTAEELQLLIARSKRKLLEFEVMASAHEIRSGKYETFNTAKELIKKSK